jgi:AraC-like DNA-binding protein
MIRAQLVDCAVQDDWSDNRLAELNEAIRAYVRRIAVPLPSLPRPLTRATLRRVVRFVNDHLDSKLKWDEIAADVGMDPYVFGKGFKQCTGMTPHDYVIRCRIRRAIKLLTRTDRGLPEIALEVGCACQSHFTTMFRKCTGTTPGAFRRAAIVGNSKPGNVARSGSSIHDSSWPRRYALAWKAPARILQRASASR